MTIKCSEIDNLLLEGDPQSLALAAEHAQTCDACMQELTTWNEMSSVAQTMHTTWTNDTLWPRIERAIQRERRARWSAVWQIAAAVAVFIAIGVAVIRVQRHREYDKHIMTAAAVSEVEDAQLKYIDAINHMEKLADAKLDNPATPLMVNYKEKLMVLDDAISECQTNIERNRNNAQLRAQLLTIYSEKQRTLQDVLRVEDTHANP